MRSGISAPVMVRSKSSHQHGPPLLGRVQVPSVPRRHSSFMQPSDSPIPVGRGSGLPLPSAYLDADACS